MNVIDEIVNETQLVYALRKAGYEKEIDAAYAAFERGEITEEQYWSYIKGLAGE